MLFRSYGAGVRAYLREREARSLTAAEFRDSSSYLPLERVTPAWPGARALGKPCRLVLRDLSDHDPPVSFVGLPLHLRGDQPLRVQLLSCLGDGLSVQEVLALRWGGPFPGKLRPLDVFGGDLSETLEVRVG